MKDLHKLGYIHNDLKLENILVGHKDPDMVYLIDFGLSPSYLTVNENDQIEHSKHTYLAEFTGNFMFASRNSCKGFSKSR